MDHYRAPLIADLVRKYILNSFPQELFTSSYKIPDKVGPRKLPNANTEVQRPETTALVVAVLEWPGMLRVARRHEL